MSSPSLVTMLEQPYADSRVDFDSQREALLLGLSSIWPSDYWPSRALDWVESGFRIDDEIAEALMGASKRASYSQAFRHRAFAVVMKWRKLAAGA